MVETRTLTPHKCFRISCCKICNPDFHEKSVKFHYSCPDGQQSCRIISLENGGYTQSRAFKNQQAKLTISRFIITAEYLPSKVNV